MKRRRDAGDTVLFVPATAGRAERIVELLKDYELLGVPIDESEGAQFAAVLVATGLLSRGFRLPDASLQIYAESDVFEEERRAAETRRPAGRAFLSDLRDLKVGDLVVHVDHGIGVVRRPEADCRGSADAAGIPRAAVCRRRQAVRSRRAARPGPEVHRRGSKPPLDRLGGTTWEKAKTRVKKAMRDMAEELLKLYAARKAVAGPRLPLPTRTGSRSSRTPSSTS